MKAYIHTKLYTNGYSSFIVRAQTWKQRSCPSRAERWHQLVHDTTGHSSAIKRNRPLITQPGWTTNGLWGGQKASPQRLHVVWFTPERWDPQKWGTDRGLPGVRRQERREGSCHDGGARSLSAPMSLSWLWHWVSFYKTLPLREPGWRIHGITSYIAWEATIISKLKSLIKKMRHLGKWYLSNDENRSWDRKPAPERSASISGTGGSYQR